MVTNKRRNRPVAYLWIEGRGVRLRLPIIQVTSWLAKRYGPLYRRKGKVTQKIRLYVKKLEEVDSSLVREVAEKLGLKPSSWWIENGF